MGYALFLAQTGSQARTAKPLKGFGSGAGVVQVSDRHEGGAYRVAYTVGLPGVVYVLHVWRKKSPTGIRTARKDVERIRARMAAARAHHEETAG